MPQLSARERSGPDPRVAVIGRRALVAGLPSLLVLAACGDDSKPEPPDRIGTPSATPTQDPPTTQTFPTAGPAPSPVVRTLVSNLVTPWGLDFLPDGSALLGNRDRGTVLHVRRDGSTSDAGTVPGLTGVTGNGGEGGLLGIAVSPRFARDRTVFCYVTTNSDNRVLRAHLADGLLGRFEPIVEGIPQGRIHNGGGLAVRPGLLYIGTGDSGHPELSPDMTSQGGKVLRTDLRGRPAKGNPFAHSRVYSIGHRNIEALAFDAGGQRLWAAEFGNQRLDELNLIRAGGDYGWPRFEGPSDGANGVIDPALTWPTQECGPAGVAVTERHIYVAALTAGRLWRIPVAGRRLGRPEALLDGEFGRLRRVVAHPDGASLWLTTSNTDGRGTPAADDDRLLELPLS